MNSIDPNFIERIDSITLDALYKTGATKWTAGDGSIGAFVAEMDFGAAPVIKAALHAAVDNGIFGYMPERLIAEMTEAMSDWYRAEYGLDLATSDVLAIPDVIKGLEVAIEHVSRPGSKIIVSTPSYMPFLNVPPALGREVIEVPLARRNGRYEYDLDGLQKAFDDGGNLLILCNPYNPIGRVFERDELVALSALVECNGGKVFSDEIWAPMVFSGHKHIPYASISDVTAGHTITATSASKGWNLPGLKCAQLILSNDRDRKKMEQVGHFVGHGTSNLGVVANIAAYRDGRPWLEETLAYLDRTRQALPGLVEEHLPGAICTVPEGTYVCWIDFNGTPVADRPAAFFKAHAGVDLTEGTACGRIGAGCVRLILATPMPILETIFSRMGKAMRDKTPA